jgi:hypothetical protein
MKITHQIIPPQQTHSSNNPTTTNKKDLHTLGFGRRCRIVESSNTTEDDLDLVLLLYQNVRREKGRKGG